MVLIEWNSWHGKEYFTSWHFLLVQHRLLPKKVHQSWLWFKSLVTPIVIDQVSLWNLGKGCQKKRQVFWNLFISLIGRHVLWQLKLTHISCQHSDTLVQSTWFQSTVRFSLELSLGKNLNISTSKFWGKLYDSDGKLNEKFIYKKQTLWKRLDDTNHLKWR